jgi:hypothetical protein
MSTRWGTSPPAPLPRTRVEIGVRQDVRIHYRLQMERLKNRIRSYPVDRIGSLGEVAGEAFRRRGWK